ncbi:uncharacterized protein LOC111323498 isoform X2 [Stylophora pistillata]|uniref:Peptide-N(4)-(N-acetyl-beta-glucosaminyl)asparagine amidase n=1 Tax=Stylophora pistillata TaxID=50429 RepID=A0A2B4SIJ6_STYPI|nr:uncharacterized protein LOC111323498 isoform X2 [Stylophora pistillata]PFX30484.1 Peptide-N(4)-(N-acetyl-beta-glucosaminyl)asparagine amidase [Stylophora pistillata]
MMSRWKQVSSLVRSKALAPSVQRSSYTFTPNKEEVIESRFRLRYSTTCNSYYRDWSDAIDPSAQGVISGWDKVLYSMDSVRRTVNEEIGQVYLESLPGSNTGYIKWRIDFGCCGLQVDEVTLRLSCLEDYGGEIVVTLTGHPGEKRVRYPIGSDYVTFTELQNSTELTLTIHFVGEAGQVIRLFPQSILRGMGYPLDLKVILKQPLESLGKPRILVGLLYSSSQEIEVDSRHYKQNTTNTGQGFLHVHLLRGMDLPSGKKDVQETFSKCYLLRDVKKSTKCRTKARKGKDPLWNEQFLIVGVNYHDVKRRALEICIADSHKSVGKKAKFIGGVRLSLGYKAVVAAQTKQVNQVLRFLKGREAMSGDVNSSFGKWRRASGRKSETDDAEKATKEEKNEDTETKDTPANKDKVDEQSAVDGIANSKNDGEETKEDIVENGPQSASSASTEIMAPTDSAFDPSQDEAKAKGIRSNRLAEQRLFEAVMASIKHLEIAARQTAAQLESSEERGKGSAEKLEKLGSTDISAQSIYIAANEGTTDLQQGADTIDPATDAVIATDDIIGDERNSLDTTKNTRSKNFQERNSLNKDETQQDGDQADDLLGVTKEVRTATNHLAKKENLPTNVSENSRTEADQILNGHNGDEDQCGDVSSITKGKRFPKKGLNTNDIKTHNSEEIPKEKPKNCSEHSTQEKTENLKSENSQPEELTISKKMSAGGSNELKRSSSFTFKDIGKKLSFRRNSKSDVIGESRSETGLQTNADKMMLDAQGLEITQWTLVVSRPKEWHYCWHILRSEMTILH